MKYTRKEVGSAQKFVVLSFEREKDDSVLNDGIVRAAMTTERLRPVSKDEFDTYRRDVLNGRKPKTCITAFGNTTRGPADSGSFPGVPYLNTNGKIGVIENWSRGNTGDQWSGEWEFLFASAA